MRHPVCTSTNVNWNCNNGRKTKEKTYQPVNFYGDPKSVLDRISKNQLSSNVKILKFVSKKQSLFFSFSQSSSYVIRIQIYQTSIQEVLNLKSKISEIINKTNLASAVCPSACQRKTKSLVIYSN